MDYHEELRWCGQCGCSIRAVFELREADDHMLQDIL